MTDQQMIERHRSGDNEVFGELYEKYIDKIYNFVFYRVRDKEEAEDIVSQVFFKAFDKLKGFNDKKGTFQAWIYSIARNSVIDHYRKFKANRKLDDIYDLCDNKEVDKEVADKIKLEKVDVYLLKLKKEQRDLVIMRVWEGLSYQEISEITKKSEASLKMSFSRTIKELRKEMPLALFISFLLRF